MPYYTRDDNDVDDFDEFDPTPYSGGYDITVIYGRPIPPSDETCYPLSSGVDDDFEYERPEFTQIHEPSAYGDEALNTEYSSYSRPKPRPAFRPDSGGGGHVQGERPNPGYGSESGYGRKPESEYGSGYGGQTEYGSGGGGRTEVEYGRRPESGLGSGYGGRSESEYERKPSYGSYGRGNDDDDDEQRRNRSGSGDDEEGSYGRKKYGGNDSDEDEEKKKHRHKHHHQKRRDEDDE
ncbi:unnamed protein product [Arabidopsis thaliana]|uniref:(thale cress) hypothetical protein n=1 Tax=Arabidopsis thaliana TaxID=3702 RepID=A0A7G2FC86_ARATH|nr:unnamed protein product [Arabidopsis thaliana]